MESALHDPILTRAIEAARWVSFDIFDTAILRKVGSPHDVFAIVEIEARLRLGRPDFDFVDLRSEAERDARHRLEQSGRLAFLSLTDIYKELENRPEIGPSVARQLMEIEIGVELNLATRNPFIHEAYRLALARGKIVLFISDMYLPEDVLAQMLDRSGYTRYRHLFVSNEVGLRKREGDLFKHVCQQIDAAPKRVLHIGDDWLSDIKMARRRGLRTYHYKRPALLAETYLPDVGEWDAGTAESGVVKGLVTNSLLAARPMNKRRVEEDYWYRLGYANVGPLYTGFALWLADAVKKDGIRKVYFLSRDGYIMEKAYQRLRESHRELPPSAYLYASRRALRFAALENFDNGELDFFLRQSHAIQVRHLLGRLGLDAGRYGDEIRKAGFAGPTELLRPLRSEAALRHLVHLLKEPILEAVEKQRIRLLTYLKELEFEVGGKVALVDIGWQGSMQYTLDRLLARLNWPTLISGYYLATFAEALRLGQRSDRMKGFLCQFSEPPTHHQAILQCVPFYEFLHTAPHGSVRGYRDVEGEVQPDFEPNFIPQQNRLAEDVQTGALDFMTDFLEVRRDYPWLALSPELAFAAVRQVVAQPSCLDAVKIGDLQHVDSFDHVEESGYFARPPAWRESLNVKRLRRVYLQSYWKMGFLRRLTCREHWLSGSLKRILESLGASSD